MISEEEVKKLAKIERHIAKHQESLKLPSRPQSENDPTARKYNKTKMPTTTILDQAIASIIPELNTEDFNDDNFLQVFNAHQEIPPVNQLVNTVAEFPSTSNLESNTNLDQEDKINNYLAKPKAPIPTRRKSVLLENTPVQVQKRPRGRPRKDSTYIPLTKTVPRRKAIPKPKIIKAAITQNPEQKKRGRKPKNTPISAEFITHSSSPSPSTSPQKLQNNNQSNNTVNLSSHAKFILDQYSQNYEPILPIPSTPRALEERYNNQSFTQDITEDFQIPNKEDIEMEVIEETLEYFKNEAEEEIKKEDEITEEIKTKLEKAIAIAREFLQQI